MKIAKLQDKNTFVVYCCPINKMDYLVSIGYTLVGYTDLQILEDKAIKMLNEFKPSKDFDFIKQNWLPIFTTANMRKNFDNQTKQDSINFAYELKQEEFWNPGKIKTNGYLNALLNNS